MKPEDIDVIQKTALDYEMPVITVGVQTGDECSEYEFDAGAPIRTVGNMVHITEKHGDSYFRMVDVLYVFIEEYRKEEDEDEA